MYLVILKIIIKPEINLRKLNQFTIMMIFRLLFFSSSLFILSSLFFSSLLFSFFLSLPLICFTFYFFYINRTVEDANKLLLNLRTRGILDWLCFFISFHIFLVASAAMMGDCMHCIGEKQWAACLPMAAMAGDMPGSV